MASSVARRRDAIGAAFGKRSSRMDLVLAEVSSDADGFAVKRAIREDLARVSAGLAEASDPMTRRFAPGRRSRRSWPAWVEPVTADDDHIEEDADSRSCASHLAGPRGEAQASEGDGRTLPPGSRRACRPPP